MTVQETYAAMMKERLAPRLRALRFKGSGQNYELGSDDYWTMLAFQKWAYSDRGRLRFTLNVLVVLRITWDAERRDRPVPERTTDRDDTGATSYGNSGSGCRFLGVATCGGK
jgi:hypothetical protein